MRTTRSGTTAIETLLAFALAATFLGLGFEVFQGLTSRAQEGSEEALRAQEIGVFSERLRRVLAWTVAVRREGATSLLFVRRFRDSRWTLEEARLGSDSAGNVWLQEGSGKRHTLGAGKDARGPLGIQVRDESGVLRVEVAERSREPILRTRVKPLPVGPKGVLFDPRADQLEALREASAGGPWLSGGRPIVPAESEGSPGSAAIPVPLPVGGIVDPPTGPLRNSLFVEASVAGVEAHPIGRALLPPKPETGSLPLDVYQATQRLEGYGFSGSEASFLALLLAGLEVPDRMFRAASLASLLSKLRPFSPAEVEEILEVGRPGTKDLLPEETQALPAPPFFSDGLVSSGFGNLVQDSDQEVPWGFGGLEEDPTQGPEPDWDSTQSVLTKDALPQQVWKDLPEDLKSRLQSEAEDLSQSELLARDFGREVGGGARRSRLDPSVAQPVELFPPLGKDALGSRQADLSRQVGEALARAPRVADATEEFQAKQNDVEIRSSQVEAAQTNLQVAQGALDQATLFLSREEQQLSKLEKQLESSRARNQFMRAKMAGYCKDNNSQCPKTRSIVAQTDQEIARLSGEIKAQKKSVRRARAARDQAEAERVQRQVQLDRSQDQLESSRTELAAADAVLQAESEGFSQAVSNE